MKPGRYVMTPNYDMLLTHGSPVIPRQALIREVMVFADMNVDGFVMTEETTDGLFLRGTTLWYKGERALRALNLYQWAPVTAPTPGSEIGA